MIALDSRICKQHMITLLDMARRYDAAALDDDVLNMLADKLASDLENAAMDQWQAEIYEWQQSLSSDQEAAA